MTTYTGPVPPPPGSQADAATWQNWIAFQIMLQNIRWEDERAARAVVTDRQHAEKMAAEAACAAATTKAAEAQAAAAAAMTLIHTTAPAEGKPWTDEQLIRQFMFGMADTVTTGGAARDRARAYLNALRTMFPTPAVPTPEPGQPGLPPLPPVPPKQGGNP